MPEKRTIASTKGVQAQSLSELGMRFDRMTERTDFAVDELRERCRPRY